MVARGDLNRLTILSVFAVMDSVDADDKQHTDAINSSLISSPDGRSGNCFMAFCAILDASYIQFSRSIW